MTHQELFSKWYAAEHSVIWERSVSITRDEVELYTEAKKYAEENGLEFDEEYPTIGETEDV